MTRFGLSIWVLICALAATGCDQGRSTPPNVRVTVVHAAPSYGPLDFMRGRTAKTQAANMNYQNALAGMSFNADTYNFSVNEAAADPSIGEELIAFTETLTADNAYTIVIAETAGDLTPWLIEQPAFPADATNAQVTLVNAAETFGTVDVYVEPAGTALASATPLGTAAFGDDLTPVTRAAGDYSLFVTAVGDPAAVVFESRSFALEAGRADLIVLTDGAGEGLAELVAVHASSAGSGLSFDLDVQSGVRFVNAANDRAARDVYLDEDFAAPFVASIAFGTLTDYQPLSPAAHDMTFTPMGNPSAIEAEGSQSFATGRLYTVVVTGESGDLNLALVQENRRPLRDTARVQFINGAAPFGNMEFYVAEPGTALEDASPVTVTAAPAISAFSTIPPADYELTIVDSDTDAVLAGPIAFTVEAGGFYSVLALEAVGGATVDVQLLDDFN